MIHEKVLLDTNLLVLFVVGTASRDLITRHKRLSAYDAGHFDQLLGIISESSEVIVTPQIMAECSNLAACIDGPARAKISSVLAQVAQGVEEIYTPSRDVVRRKEFEALGIADAASLCVVENGFTLLTVDLGLYLAALAAGYRAVNFNHLN